MHLTRLLTQDIKDEIYKSSSAESLNSRFKSVMRSLDFTAYAIGFLPDLVTKQDTKPTGSAPFLLLDWPIAWLELYARQGFAADDVVVAEAARTVDPFTWSEVREKYPGASARIFKAAADFGWEYGFVIPVHNARAAPGERFGVASLASGPRSEFDVPQRQMITSIVLTAFARAVTLRGRGGQMPVAEALSPRERESLALVAEGLEDAEIGASLGVTRATAHYHVERAKKRLNAKTRAQAVAIAMMQGLL